MNTFKKWLLILTQSTRTILTFSLLTFFFSTALINLASSLDEDTINSVERITQTGAKISFITLPKDKTSWKDEKSLFVKSFMEAYELVPPEQLNSKFKAKQDVKEWLGATFQEECENFKKASHPLNFIVAFNEKAPGNIIGLMIIEQWQNKKDTLHIRQLAIGPKHKRHGYGKALMELVTDTKSGANQIIVDARTVNSGAQGFYKAMGFVKANGPHDPTLSSDKYEGFKWLRPAHF